MKLSSWTPLSLTSKHLFSLEKYGSESKSIKKNTTDPNKKYPVKSSKSWFSLIAGPLFADAKADTPESFIVVHLLIIETWNYSQYDCLKKLKKWITTEISV